MLKYIILSTIGILSSLQSSSQSMRLVWYNVENIFDTIDSPDTHDEEYTPQSDKEWNSWKYWTKLKRTAKVLRNASGFEAPDIIGLAEIENAEVLYHLSTRAPLKNIGYRIAHYESPDARGIDVGLLYNPETVNLYASRPLTVRIDSSGQYHTRDILLVSGVFAGDTFHLALNHWPSRRGGKEQSEPRRITASNRLLTAIDSLMELESNPTVFVAGDFNDGPDDKSLLQLEERGFINQTRKIEVDERGNYGTHRYRGEWAYLDQWLTLNSAQNHFEIDSIYVYSSPAMLEDAGKYLGVQPKRSWSGPFFTSGYSDHLPLVLILTHHVE